ncbi:MAG TPA: ABC transporter permease subunit [Tepidisphaeraceae bacterium]|nr:ABC transporter permease subunit [Tepidisphaeraceae bacterium]
MYPHLHNLPLLSAGELLANNWGWLVVALIVIFGLFVAGASDVMRFSFTRVWAISGVCFDESIRKRVLWITPLAIVGAIGITQFQRALDEQDAVRQSLKVCLFATAVVVMLSSIILACTNLPKEIESRVIYTIVTKPITRLELVLGKVIGFSRVALAIVIIMGLFTWAYMRISAHQKGQQIAYRLQEGDVSDTERGRLVEYQQTGLLTARSFWAPDELGMFGAPPDPRTPIRIISNQGDEDFVVSYLGDRAVLFGPPSDNVEDWAHQGIGENGLAVRVTLNTRRTGKADDQPPTTHTLGPTFGPPPVPARLVPPRVSFEILDQDYNDIDMGNLMIGGSSAGELVQNIVAYSKTRKINPAHSGAYVRLSEPAKLSDGSTAQYAYAWLPPQTALALFNHPAFRIRIVGGSANVDYLVGTRPVDCFIPEIKPGEIDIDGPHATKINPLPGVDGAEELLAFRGHLGVHYDQEMNGGSDSPNATAMYSFRNTPPPSLLVQDQIPLQISVQVERSNSDVEAGHEDATALAVRVIDDATKKVTALPNPVLVESRLPAYFSIPADAITTGNFDIIFHCMNNEESIGLFPDSLQLIISHQPFELNLIKSLFIIWMMSILVIIFAVLCSTFLSWPIAIVLTVLLLLGHWGVDQLADVSGPGLGRQIVSDFKFTDPALSSVVSTGVDTLSRILNGVSQVLPDTSKFDAIEDIEQGVSVSAAKMLEALTVLGGFGVPAIILAYLVLRNKEVAP